MTPPRLVMIHTVPALAETFGALAQDGLHTPAQVAHVVDDSLLSDTIAAGSLSPRVSRRLAEHVFAAEDEGAAVILVTCSSMGPAVEAARAFCSVPLLRVDEPMIDRAIDTGSVIGVVGTLATTLQPTTDLVRRRAAERQRPVEVISRLAEGAFEALRSGDTDEHDRRVRAVLRELLERADVVVLAQASMARVADQLEEAERGSVEILSSPRASVEQAADTLRTVAAGA
jgi:Asp/Glu/hydantoin racemase